MTGATTKPGDARAPGPTLHEQLLADPTSPPAPLLVESPMFLGDADIAFANYTSPAYADAEAAHMWSKTWQWACHLDHIPERGDYYVYEVAHHSALAGTRMSRCPLVLIELTRPAFSMSSTSRAARL